MAKKLHVHERRGVTFQEYGALLATREMLLNGTLVFSTGCLVRKGVHAFNMKTQGEQQECGSVGCIGGTMAMVMGKNPTQYVGIGGQIGTASRPFHDLFYPSSAGDWSWITPKVAVKGIDNWLRIGKPCWERLYNALPAASKKTGF